MIKFHKFLKIFENEKDINGKPFNRSDIVKCYDSAKRIYSLYLCAESSMDDFLKEVEEKQLPLLCLITDEKLAIYAGVEDKIALTQFINSIKDELRLRSHENLSDNHKRVILAAIKKRIDIFCQQILEFDANDFIDCKNESWIYKKKKAIELRGKSTLKKVAIGVGVVAGVSIIGAIIGKIGDRYEEGQKGKTTK